MTDTENRWNPPETDTEKRFRLSTSRAFAAARDAKNATEEAARIALETHAAVTRHTSRRRTAADIIEDLVKARAAEDAARAAYDAAVAASAAAARRAEAAIEVGGTIDAYGPAPA